MPKNFEFDFFDNDSFVVDADTFTKEQAAKLYEEEMKSVDESITIDLNEVKQKYCAFRFHEYYPNGAYTIYDEKVNGAFPVWVIE